MVSSSITICGGQRRAFQTGKDAKPSLVLSARPLSAELGYVFSAAQKLLNFVRLGMRCGARMESRFCWAHGKAGCRVRPTASSQTAHKPVPFTDESSYRP